MERASARNGGFAIGLEVLGDNAGTASSPLRQDARDAGGSGDARKERTHDEAALLALLEARGLRCEA